MPNQELELAWAAGFFDGEGNVRFSRTKHKKNREYHRAYGTLVLQTTQIDRRVLDRFCLAVGVGKIYGPYTLKKRNHQCLKFSAHGADAEFAYEKLRPYLSPVKLQQGETALAEYKEQHNRPSYYRFKNDPCSHQKI
jgi:hypothetical protein